MLSLLRCSSFLASSTRTQSSQRYCSGFSWPGTARSADAATASDVYPKGPIQPPGQVHRLLDTYKNLYADLSAGSARLALERDPGHAERFLNDYSTRLFFARDYYGTELHEFLSTLNLKPETIESIYWRNAEKLIPAPTAK